MEDCKKSWGSIRDQFRKTLNKRKTKSGQAAENNRKYKYEDIISFLVPYLGEKEGLTNVPLIEDEETDEFLNGDADSHDIPTVPISEEPREEKTATEIASTSNTSMRSQELSPLSTYQVPEKKISLSHLQQGKGRSQIMN